jgi:type I restriction-modification system DNA methylase subunit
MLSTVAIPNDSRKATGAHYTPSGLADFVAEKIIDSCTDSLKNLRVLDPAAGDGSLLEALLARLPGAQKAFGYDTDPVAVSRAMDRLGSRFPSAQLEIAVQDFTALCSPIREGDLFNIEKPALFDLVIANPPYVRTQVMGASRSQDLAGAYGLTGRVDLYFSFLICIARVLKPGGIAGVIVSNRFMTTRAGAEVRKRLLEDFDILHVWDLGDTRLFEAAVLPAVLIMRRKAKDGIKAVAKFSSIYSVAGRMMSESCRAAASVFDALREEGSFEIGGQIFHVKHGTLDHTPDEAGVWRIATDAGDEWLATVQRHTACTFAELGKIRVGVKTTADKVFIRDDWHTMPPEQRPELLRPLITHQNARRYRANGEARKAQILYTHETRDGKRQVVELAAYPKASAYLESHRRQLELRRYVIEAGRNWFEIWVPQNPQAWKAPKLVFPDISEKPTFWIDLDGSVVNGDCYWIATTNGKHAELLWLAMAVGNSSFIEEYYDHLFNNKLYAGRRRFMTQYVERFPLPRADSEEARELMSLTKEIYRLTGKADTKALETRSDALVRRAFGLHNEEVAGKRNL